MFYEHVSLHPITAVKQTSTIGYTADGLMQGAKDCRLIIGDNNNDIAEPGTRPRRAPVWPIFP